ASPKLRVKATCCWSVICWSGNTTTRCFIQASWIALTVPASTGFVMSTPRISAPRAGCRGLTVIAIVSSSAVLDLVAEPDRAVVQRPALLQCHACHRRRRACHLGFGIEHVRAASGAVHGRHDREAELIQKT